MVLRVIIAGEPWLADVGFGGFGLLEPIPLSEGATAEQGGAHLHAAAERRVGAVDADRVRTTDLYEFTEDPQTAGDIEVANHYTSTHPVDLPEDADNPAQRPREERALLRSDSLRRGAAKAARSRSPSLALASTPSSAREFGVDLPDGPFVFEAQPPR